MKNGRFIAGFIAGSLLFGTAGAYAASKGKLIEVFYEVKDIKINKVSQMPKGDQQPFMYNGSTYVPLRFVAEALKQPVKWDAKTRSIYIGETDTPNSVYPARDMKHMNAQGGYFSRYSYAYDSQTPIEDNIGNKYSNYITFEFPRYDNGSNSRFVNLQFPLNGTVKKFKAKAGFTGTYRDSAANVTLRIFADDTEVYNNTFKPGDFPKELDIDFSHAAKVEFKVSADQERIQFGLFDAHFEK